jgi:hypothetical protein
MQPLSRVRPNAHVEFGNSDATISRPKVALRIAQCVAEWADTETLLGILLATLLNTDAKSALALWAATDNRAAQIRILSAVAEQKLPENGDLWTVIKQLYVTPAMKDRDKLVHWCWGSTADLPDDLLLMKPSEKITFHHDAFGAPSKPQISGEGIFVVTEADLIRMAQRFLTAKNYVLEVRSLVWDRHPPHWRAEQYQRLCNEPQIAEALIRLRTNPKNNQAEHE